MSVFSVSLEELRSRQSLKWRSYPPDVLPLWVAEMDVELHPAIRETLLRAVTSSDTGYPHGTAYAEAFAAMAAARWEWRLDPASQIRRAGDVMNSMLAVLMATTSPGDAVVINPPVYQPFQQVVAGYHRQIVPADLDASGRLDLAAIEAAFAGPTHPRAYLLCSPHNPNGTVHSAAELTAVMELARRYAVQVIVDEIHAPLVDPGTSFVPLQSVPGGEHAITVTSAGKAWNLAGFKAGLILAGPAVTGVLAQLPPLAQQSSGHLGNLAHTTALLQAQDWVDQVMVEVAANKKLLAALLAQQVPTARYVPAPGTYLAWVDCSETGLSAPARQFEEVGRVAFSPGTNFARSADRWVRVNLAAAPDVITEAVTRMAVTVAAVS